ncbi:MAG: sensor histidine kinase, partial [Spirochaetaceae bacterium]
MKNIPPDNKMEVLQRYIWEDAPQLVLVITGEGKIIQCNKSVKRNINPQAENMLIQDLLVEFSPQIDLAMAIKKQDPCLYNFRTSSGLPQSFRFRFFAYDGHIIAIGETDANETAELRKQMLEINNEFSNINRELHKKNAELEQLHQLKNRFLGMAAHDLRNPVASICSLSDFLLHNGIKSLSNDQVDLLSMIKESGEFMLSLLEELLSIAKIEAGRIDLSFQTGNYSDFLLRNVKLNRILASKRNIKIHLQAPMNIYNISFDRMKLDQVLNNLISNAVKFSPDGNSITVSVFDDGLHLITCIADNGKGISDQEIPNLFTPFYKSSEKAYSKERSTGLGLFIAKQIILAHKGKIWVDSTPGSGSAFYFSLP